MKQCFKMLLLLLFIVGCGSLFAQKQGQAKIDSLLHVLQTQKEDTNKVKLLNELSFVSNNTDDGIKYGQLALELATKLNFKIGQATANKCLGNNFLNKSDYNRASSYYEVALAEYTKVDYKDGIARVNLNLGNMHQLQSDYPKALENYITALNIYDKTNDNNGKLTALNSMSFAYIYMSNFPKALECYFKILNIYERTGNKFGIANVSGNIGNVYLNQHDLPKALSYYFQSLKIHESLSDSNGAADNLGNIGIVYFDQNEYQKALEYYYKALNIYEKLNNKSSIATNTANIGSVYEKQHDYIKALEFLFLALKLNKETGDEGAAGLTNSNIGDVYLTLATDTSIKTNRSGFYDLTHIYSTLPPNSSGLLPLPPDRIPKTKTSSLENAIIYLQRGLKIGEQMLIPGQIEYSYEKLASAYKLTGDYKKSMESYENYIEIKDSIFNKENAQKILKLSFEDEYQRKRLTDSLTAQRKEEKAILKLQRQRTYTFSGIAGICVLLAFTVFLVRNNRVQKSLNNTIRKLVTEQEETIEQRTSQLAYANKKLVELIQYNAHNLREPLTRISGAMNIQEYIPCEEFFKDIWPQMQKAVTDLDNNIKDVINIADETVGRFG